MEWAPGGENTALHASQPSLPWWWPMDSVIPDVAEAEVPYTLLPSHLCADAFTAQEEGPSVASEIPSWRGWHCLSCGQLNAQRFLCSQDCDTCQVGLAFTMSSTLVLTSQHCTDRKWTKGRWRTVRSRSAWHGPECPSCGPDSGGRRM